MSDFEYLYILVSVNGEALYQPGPGRIPVMFAERDDAPHAARQQAGRDVQLEYYDGQYQLVHRERVPNRDEPEPEP